jgi:Ca-activated chloride channel family protein
MVVLAACSHTRTSVPKTVDVRSPGRCAAVDVATEPDAVELLAKRADAFNGSSAAKFGNGDCAFVRVQPVEPGNVFTELGRGWQHPNVYGPAPSMWLPGTSAWLERLNEVGGAVGADAGTSLLRTPLVLAAPAGAPRPSGWRALAQMPAGTVGLARADASTTGLLAALALRRIGDDALTSAVQHAVAYYAQSDAPYFENAGQLSAIVTSARAVDAYDRAHPKSHLVGAPPSDGPIELDYPLATLDAPWMSVRARAAARTFATYAAAHGAHPDDPGKVAPALGDWQHLRKPARLTILFDVSESMNDPSDSRDADSPSKLTEAKQALLDALPLLGPDDEVGLRIFSTKLPAPTPYWQDVVPRGRYADVREELERAVEGLTAHVGSPLYAATRATFDDLDRDADPSHIDGMVLLTDGYDEVHADRAALLAHLHPPVRIFPIPYSTQADVDTLEMFAAATHAHVYSAKDPRVIRLTFAGALSSF